MFDSEKNALTEKSYTIDILKFMAIFLVVLGHSISQYKKMADLNRIEKILNSMIYCVHVPLFFTISGFLSHKQSLLVYYRKKIRRIFIPFVFFSCLKLLYSNLLSTSYIHGSTLGEQLIDAFLIGSLYWFIYCLLLMYLIAPVLWVDVGKKIPWVTIAVLIVFVVINILNSYFDFINISSDHRTYFQIGTFIYYLPFFLIGFLIARIDHKTVFNNKLIYVLGLCIFLLFTYFLLIRKIQPVCFSYLMDVLFSLSIMILLILISHTIKKTDKIILMGSTYSLQIMFLDSFYKAILYTVYERLLNQFQFIANFSIVFLLALIDFALCLLTCWIVDKIKFVRFLFGL